MPVLRVNYHKYDAFYSCRFNKTKNGKDYNDIVKVEDIDGLVCDNDPICIIDE